jgi:hypothetical protein
MQDLTPSTASSVSQAGYTKTAQQRHIRRSEKSTTYLRI